MNSASRLGALDINFSQLSPLIGVALPAAMDVEAIN